MEPHFIMWIRKMAALTGFNPVITCCAVVFLTINTSYKRLKTSDLNCASIQSSILPFPSRFILFRVTGALEPISADFEWQAGYTLGRPPVHRGTSIGTFWYVIAFRFIQGVKSYFITNILRYCQCNGFTMRFETYSLWNCHANKTDKEPHTYLPHHIYICTLRDTSVVSY